MIKDFNTSRGLDERSGGASLEAPELRHYARRHISGDMEIVDRAFDWVRCRLPYDYRWTSNGQQWDEARRICEALEGPMHAQGFVYVADTTDRQLSPRDAKQNSPPDQAHEANKTPSEGES